MGKTAFVLSLARNVAVDYEKGVAFFSLEMSAEQLMMRLIVGESGLDSRDVRNGQLTPEQWKHLEASFLSITSLQSIIIPLFFYMVGFLLINLPAPGVPINSPLSYTRLPLK